MGYEGFTRAYLEAIRRGFNFARELGRVCGPVHLLVGISEGSGPPAAALSAGRPVAEIVASAGDALGDGAAYLHVQAQGAARLFAASLGQRVGTEHLLIALLDQGTTEVQQALAHAGADPAAVRRAALTAVGAPDGQPPLALPPLTPAGTMDRPPLPVDHLDGRAWSVLRWRWFQIRTISYYQGHRRLSEDPPSRADRGGAAPWRATIPTRRRNTSTGIHWRTELNLRSPISPDIAP